MLSCAFVELWPNQSYAMEAKHFTVRKDIKYIYSLKNEINVKNNRLYQMGSQKKWRHLR